MPNRRTYDHAMLLKPAGLVAASAAGSVILDLGNGLAAGKLIVEISAIEIASNDEIYTISLQGSNVANMSTGKVTLAEKQFGNVPAPSDADILAGRYSVPFRNELNGSLYRYVRLYTAVAGAIATGINFTAYLEMKS